MPIPAAPQEIYFLDETYIKKFTPINGAVDVNLIYPALAVAHDIHLKKWIGQNLLVKLRTDYAAGTITGDYSTLVADYLRKAVLWWTMVELLPKLLYKYDNGGLVTRQSEDTQSISDEVMKSEIDRAKQAALTYTETMIDYLNANPTSFPEYSNNVIPNKNPSGLVCRSTKFTVSAGNSAMSQND